VYRTLRPMHKVLANNPTWHANRMASSVASSPRSGSQRSARR
jgi:hypothetical protein